MKDVGFWAIGYHDADSLIGHPIEDDPGYEEDPCNEGQVIKQPLWLMR